MGAQVSSKVEIFRFGNHLSLFKKRDRVAIFKNSRNSQKYYLLSGSLFHLLCSKDREKVIILTTDKSFTIQN